MSNFTHSGNEKKKFVQEMFDDISSHYDFLNHFLSLGIDIFWRKKFIKKMNLSNNTSLLDVACGTGDVCFEIQKKYNISITGLDLSENMIILANKKAQQNNQQIKFIHGDGENLPFKDNTFDYLTISYGFRNISNYEKALKEFYRVLKPEGRLGILEFSKPKSKIIGRLFRFYFHHILPKIGNFFSKSNAYQYLPESVDFFPTRNDICEKIISSGFNKADFTDLTFGISSIFIGYKNNV